jgi:hypothetical protein
MIEYQMCVVGGFVNLKSQVLLTPRATKYGFTTSEFTSGVIQSRQLTLGRLE